MKVSCFVVVGGVRKLFDLSLSAWLAVVSNFVAQRNNLTYHARNKYVCVCGWT